MIRDENPRAFSYQLCGTGMGGRADCMPIGVGEVSGSYVVEFFGPLRAKKLLEGAGLWNGAGALPQAISKAVFWQLCIENIRELNDEGQGCTSRVLPRSTWSMVFAAVNQMGTLRSGLRKLAELVESIDAGLQIKLSYNRMGALLNFTATHRSPTSMREEYYLECIALTIHCVLLWITAAELEPQEIRLSDRLNADEGSLLSGLSSNVTRRGNGLTLIYRHEDLDLPVGQRTYTSACAHETISFREITWRFSEHHNQPGDNLVVKVQHLISLGHLSQGDIARRLGYSTATLRRRLAEAGTSFRTILEEERKAMLLTLLAGEGSLDDIAAQLGFLDRRSLWRSCQNWFGMAPGSYRRRLRKERMSVAGLSSAERALSD